MGRGYLQQRSGIMCHSLTILVIDNIACKIGLVVVGGGSDIFKQYLLPYANQITVPVYIVVDVVDIVVVVIVVVVNIVDVFVVFVTVVVIVSQPK